MHLLDVVHILIFVVKGDGIQCYKLLRIYVLGLFHDPIRFLPLIVAMFRHPFVHLILPNMPHYRLATIDGIMVFVLLVLISKQSHLHERRSESREHSSQ